MAAAVLLLLTGLLAASAAAQNSSTPACVSGNAVHMIIARASTEPQGPGIIGQVATRVAAQLPGSDSEAVVYPATLGSYPQSEAAGVVAMTRLLTEYASRCPASKIVMMGYSQGAQVTADVLCGTDEGATFAPTAAVATEVQDKVAAVVLMGDPSKAANQTFVEGTSTKDGVFPRTATDGCRSMIKRMVSYCNAGDTFCDSGNMISVHLSYVENNGTAATDFVVAQARMNAGGSSVTNSSAAGLTAVGAKKGMAVMAVVSLLGLW